MYVFEFKQCNYREVEVETMKRHSDNEKPNPVAFRVATLAWQQIPCVLGAEHISSCPAGVLYTPPQVSMDPWRLPVESWQDSHTAFPTRSQSLHRLCVESMWESSQTSHGVQRDCLKSKRTPDNSSNSP